MKNKIRVLLTAIFLITLCSCRQLIVKSTIWVMECEHGTITVTSGNGVYDYLITAKPDEGYCLEKDNLIVRKMDNGRLHTTLWTYEVEDNIYGINPSSSVSTIVVTGIFTEVENKK